MRKARMPIITTCILLILSLAGYLVFRKDSPQKIIPIQTDKGKAAASTVSSDTITNDNTDSSGNHTYIPPSDEYDDNNEKSEEDNMSNNRPTPTPWTPATEMDLDPKSITVYVNKEYCLPKDYVPENLVIPNIPFDSNGNSERKYMRKEAAEAIERMFFAAQEDGITLYGISGYRSYSRQKDIFRNNIVHKGKKHTLKYSAAPGTSEHQTGLAMDVSSKSVHYKLVTSFANCIEGIWLADNAHKFGFIIRYPKDQYEITGYAYEPWHIRYVGEDLANYLYTNNLTLDEYYNYEPSEDFDYEKKYADLINYKPPITPTPIPEEELEEPLPDLTDEELEDTENDDIEDGESDDEENGGDLEDEDLDSDASKDEEADDENTEDENIEDEVSDMPDDESQDENLDNQSPTPTPPAFPSPTPTPVPTETPTNPDESEPSD